ncbi:MAG TPA: cytochrome c [Methylomirabilota bacterium]|nr:cytochrome c [Methylomirabilota bacterium]
MLRIRIDRSRRGRLAPVALAVAGLAALAVAGSSSAQSDVVARGEYLVKIMDCSGCHTPGALAGKPDFARRLGGSDVGFRVPGVGVVYPPNLTPDAEAGLGRWSDEQIVRAVKFGERPDGRRLIPVMPWPSYSALTDADVRALVAYLRTLPAVATPAPANAKEGERAPAPYLDVVVPR